MSLTLESKRERDLARWEGSVLDPDDRRVLGEAETRAVVNHVWADLGLAHPPLVKWVPKGAPGHIKEAWARATTTALEFMQPPNTITVLHELAHAVTEDPLDRMELRRLVEREVHGPVWLANYLHLLDRYMGPRFNKGRVMATLPPCYRPAWAPRIAQHHR